MINYLYFPIISSANMTIEQLKQLHEAEDRVEFKEARRNYPFNGGSHKEQADRRKCFLGYIVALSNEGVACLF